MDNKNRYTYNLWAWTYINGDYKEWHKTIHRKNELTEEQKEKLPGKFADDLAWEHHCNIALYGCNAKANASNVVKYLHQFQKENPKQVIIVETPNGTAELKIGDALIYEGMRGEIIIDSE